MKNIKKLPKNYKTNIINTKKMPRTLNLKRYCSACKNKWIGYCKHHQNIRNEIKEESKRSCGRCKNNLFCRCDHHGRKLEYYS
jgi:hypothetical protein